MSIGYLDSQYLTDIADAIRSKDGSQNTYTPSQMPQAILDIPSGGSIENPAVRFFDFDGTIVEELTDQELTDLTELPSPPDHSQDEIPLTFDEWNWTLVEIKSFRTSNPTWTVNVGANYHTTDNKVHLTYDIPLDGWTTELRSTSKSFDIDWGDGTSESIVAYAIATHTYSSKGKYHVQVSCSQTGGVLVLQSSTGTTYSAQRFLKEIRCPNASKIQVNITGNCQNIESISIPSDRSEFSFLSAFNLQWFTLSRNATGECTYPGNLRYSPMTYAPSLTGVRCSKCSNLEELYLPSNVVLKSCGEAPSLKRVHLSTTSQSNLGNSLFIRSGVREVNIPQGTTDIGSSFFMYCPSLEEITLPNTLTSIGASCFSNCSLLKEIVIPDSVTSLGNYCFSDAPAMVIMKSTTPPTIGTNCFNTQIHTIIVPYSADHSVLNNYKTAWSAYADIILEEPAP